MKNELNFFMFEACTFYNKQGWAKARDWNQKVKVKVWNQPTPDSGILNLGFDIDYTLKFRGPEFIHQSLCNLNGLVNMLKFNP